MRLAATRPGGSSVSGQLAVLQWSQPHSIESFIRPKYFFAHCKNLEFFYAAAYQPV
jgi:hypothetical protein